jgi:hypothetical protein
LAGCACHACRHHTRAYLHHLLRAKEMLGEILLYRHNQHQLVALFDACRARLRPAGSGGAASGGDFAAWANHIIAQMHE